MNVYTGLLFLQGHLSDASVFAEPADYRRPSYGNPAANERALRERWDDEPRAGHPSADSPADSRAA